MKVRVFYKGYENRYFPQYRKFGMWRDYTVKHSLHDDPNGGFATEKEAIKYLEHEKIKKELELMKLKRDKLSRSVYETEI